MYPFQLKDHFNLKKAILPRDVSEKLQILIPTLQLLLSLLFVCTHLLRKMWNVGMQSIETEIKSNCSTVQRTLKIDRQTVAKNSKSLTYGKPRNYLQLEPRGKSQDLLRPVGKLSLFAARSGFHSEFTLFQPSKFFQELKERVLQIQISPRKIFL